MSVFTDHLDFRFVAERPKPEPFVVSMLALAHRDGNDGKLEFTVDELDRVGAAAYRAQTWYTLRYSEDRQTIVFESNLLGLDS